MDGDDESSHHTNELFYRIAQFSLILSVGSLVILFASIFFAVDGSARLRAEIVARSENFMIRSENVWKKLHRVRDKFPSTNNDADNHLHRWGKRAAAEFGLAIDDTGARGEGGGGGPPRHKLVAGCNKCVWLSCQPGPAGPAGPPGEDGAPGTIGAPAKPGIDGLDVMQDPLPDLPCIVCPAGPTGSRGSQGERGWLGEKGKTGSMGVPGQHGTNGGFGNIGSAGKRGLDGLQGKKGADGESIVAGVGLKGVQGLPGPAGPTGPPGLSGRPSNVSGKQGKPGTMGPTGPSGDPGAKGNPGLSGPMGDSGIPSSYCSTDCGVSRILAPSSQNSAFPFLAMSHDDPNWSEYDSTEETYNEADGKNFKP